MEIPLTPEKFHRDILETMTSGVLVTDPSGAILLANTQALKFLRLDQDPLGKRLVDLLPDAEALLESTGSGEQKRINIQDKNGHLMMLGFTSTMTPDARLRITLFRDLGAVTELMKMQMQIAQSEERFRTIFNNMRSGVVLTDQKGSVKLINKAACRQLRIASEQTIIGKRLVDVVPGSAPLLDDASREQNQHLVITFEDGTRRIIGYTSLALEIEGQRITMLRDLTPIMEAEKKNRRAEQLAQVGLFTAKLSHELKNPIASILAGLQSIEWTADLSPDDRMVLETVIGEARSLSNIVDRMLCSARPQEIINPTSLKVSIILKQCLQTHKALGEKYGITLHLVPGPPFATIKADAQAMRRIMTNLVQNAFEASPTGSQVIVGWKMLDAAEKDKRWPNPNENPVCIWVEDQGTGIPDELLERVFDPFVTTKSSGTGLGLSVVHDLVTSQGGIIDILKPDNPNLPGTRFELLMESESNIEAMRPE